MHNFGGDIRNRPTMALKGYSHNRTEGGVFINNDISLDSRQLASSTPYLVSHKNM